MRVLLVSGIQVFPPQSGGNLRTAALAQSLADLGHQVWIYSFTGRKPDYLERRPSELTSPRPGIREYINRSRLFGFLQWLTYQLGLPDLWHALPFPAPRLLRAWRHNSDLVVADFPYLARHLRGAKQSALNSHNLEFERWGVTAPLVKKLEVAAARRARIIFVPSSRERSFFSDASPGSRILQIPNAVLPERFERLDSREDTRHRLAVGRDTRLILFAASQYGPNREALGRLLSFEEKNREWLVRRKLQFLVVGSVSAPVRTLGLIATGPVDEVEPYFAAADFAINPVESGSGTNLKMAEYLAARLPVVSTAFGARGFPLTPSVDFVSLSETSWKDALEIIAELSKESSKVMAEAAFEKTRNLVDMRAIIRETLLPALT